MAHSFFSYKNIFHGSDVMIFIPHEDDEINIAGAAIYGLKQEGFHVTCVLQPMGIEVIWQKQGYRRLRKL